MPAASGNVFVIRGDLSRCQADAVVLTTSTALLGEGHLQPSFNAWPGFRDWYHQLPRGGRVGDTDWLPATDGRPAGLVLVRAVGQHDPRDPAEQAARVLEQAVARARAELARVKPGGPWLVLVPALLAGKGGGGHVLRQVAEASLRRAHELVAAAPELDLAFILFTPANHALYREARRRIAPPPVPPALAEAGELIDAVRRDECVLFVGSGVSLAASLPSWDQLIQALAARVGLPCPERPSYEEKLRVAQDYRRLAAERGLPDAASVAHELFGGKRTPVLAHYLLAQLETRLLLTTNYDRLLEDTLEAVRRPFRRVTSAAHVPATSLRGVTQIVKLHGDAAPACDRDAGDGYGDIVLSAEDYQTFPQRRAAFDLLLGALMLNHTFLFVGYSVTDENVRQTWTRIVEAINQRRADTGHHRRAFGLVFKPRARPASGVEWVDPAAGIAEPTAADRIRAQWRFLDALAEHVREPAQLLAPDAVDGPLAHVRARLREVGRALTAALAGPAALDGDDCLAAARVAELLYELGWRPERSRPSDPWVRLAEASAGAPDDARDYLDMALGCARSADEAAWLRRRREGDDCP